MTTPAEVLASMLRSDPARPRVTFYDDAPGASAGERVELSARVLANWVSKAGNALQDELDAGPGTTVALCLPVHWRALYWALSAWAVGATVVLPAGAEEAVDVVATADVVVTAEPALAADAPGRAVLVSLPMLARAHPGAPGGALDEARELPTYGDVLDVREPPAADDVALRVGRDGAPTAYRSVVVPRQDWGAAPRVHLWDALPRVLTDALSAWALDGSVVLVREPSGDQAARLAAEGVTVDLSAGRR